MADNQHKELKKHVAAIHISNPFSLLQRKLSNALLHSAYHDLEKKEEHEISVKQLARLVGFERSNDHALLKHGLRKMAETIVEWNILDNENKEEWGVTTMLAQATLKDGTCRYAYSPELRRKLFNPVMYSRINLALQNKFKGGYALALYENCNRYKGIGSTGWIEVDTLKRLLGVKDSSYYQSFKAFNQKIIKPAVNEVNEISDIELRVETERKIRKIAFIRFSISLKKSPPFSAHSKTATPAHPVERRLHDFGFTPTQAAAYRKKHNDTYILQNLDHVEVQFKDGRIQTTLTAYAASALKQDFRPCKTPVELTRENKRKEREQEWKDKTVATEMKSRQEREQRQQVEQTLQRLPLHRLKKLESGFVNNVLADSPFLKSRYERHGIDAPGVKTLFLNFVDNATN